MNNKSVAIITARGGSKRIPRKNIKQFEGQPIIKYSIDAALNAQCFDEVMVSTEDQEIAEIALACGAKVPFMRSEDMARDDAGLADVLKEVIYEYKKRKIDFNYACCISATAPFISAKKLEEGYKLIVETKAELAMTVSQYPSPIEWAMKVDINNKNRIKPNNPDDLAIVSQELRPSYYDACQFYWLNVETFIKQEDSSCFYKAEIAPVIIPQQYVQDIDTFEDWEIAELKYRIIKGQKNESRI